MYVLYSLASGASSAIGEISCKNQQSFQIESYFSSAVKSVLVKICLLFHFSLSEFSFLIL